ncbi:hypothetical protein ACPPVO_42955 [Dactylosporangium sp. McL0621]|uniref:hypothetical protein n=1 Tax=Dactylosporangium sp. McL0621 TaxID=3415678 RepID=UPI003CFA20F3
MTVKQVASSQLPSGLPFIGGGDIAALVRINVERGSQLLSELPFIEARSRPSAS